MVTKRDIMLDNSELCVPRLREASLTNRLQCQVLVPSYSIEVQELEAERVSSPSLYFLYYDENWKKTLSIATSNAKPAQRPSAPLPGRLPRNNLCQASIKILALSASLSAINASRTWALITRASRPDIFLPYTLIPRSVQYNVLTVLIGAPAQNLRCQCLSVSFRNCHPAHWLQKEKISTRMRKIGRNRSH